jgi:hypothetical protein
MCFQVDACFELRSIMLHEVVLIPYRNENDERTGNTGSLHHNCFLSG